jgi:uncharacterized membrane protein YoaT (DUF817 family)
MSPQFGLRAGLSPGRSLIWEFLVFGLKESRACIFAGGFFLILIGSRHSMCRDWPDMT